jgi:hypothetical protein
MVAAVGFYPRFKSTIPATGLPNVGGTVQFFAAVTSTPLPVYSDATLTVPLANPLTLDANGEALFYTGVGVAYKVTVRDPVGTLIWTEDNIIFGGGSGSSVVTAGGEWVQFSGTPTFINATSFSVVGDQTATFTVGRRTKSTVTAGTAYGTISSAVFSLGNTVVTLLNDVGSALDSGLSVVQVGVLDPAHISSPNYSTAIRKNFLTNGAMLLSQRFGNANPQTIAFNRAYHVDRWQVQSGVGGSAVVQQVGTVNLLNGFPFALRVQRTAANAAVTPIQLAQSLESLDSYPLNGAPVLLSFWAIAGANYSPAGSLLNCQIQTGTGTDQSIVVGYTGAVTVQNANVVLGPTWQKFQLPIANITSAGANEVGVMFTMTPVGVAGANDYYQITGVQLEPAPFGNAAVLASDFDHRPYADLLERCQRYYEKSFTQSVVPAQNAGNNGPNWPASKAGATAQVAGISYQFTKRQVVAAPLFYNPVALNGQVRDITAGVDCTAIALSGIGDKGFCLGYTGNAATVVGNQMAVHWTADAEIN